MADCYSFKNHTLCVDDVPVDEIVSRLGSPVLIYSRRKLVENARSVLEALRGVASRVNVHYAYKACPITEVTMPLHATGLGAEVGSDFEFLAALKAGCPPESIVWNSVCKTESELELALAHRPIYWHLDALEEAKMLSDKQSYMGQTQKVVLRVSPGTATKYLAPGSKLGHAISTGEALDACLWISRLPNLKLCGLHCHALIEEKNAEVYAELARELRNFGCRVEAACATRMEYLNLGGGLPGLTDMERSGFTLDQVADALKGALQDFHGIVTFEPGRALVADAAVALGRLLAKKHCREKTWWITDINTSLLVTLGGREFNFQPSMLNSRQQNVIVGIGDRASSYSAVLNHEVQIQDCPVGSIIVATECGAYTYSARQLFIFPNHTVGLVDADKTGPERIRLLPNGLDPTW